MPARSSEGARHAFVSMESGLEDRNNQVLDVRIGGMRRVSMESGLEDRNNMTGAA